MQSNNYGKLISEIMSGNNALVFLSAFIEALDDLPPEMRKAIDLKYNREYTMLMIAQEMNISVNKAAQYIHSGKVQLRRQLNPEYYQREISKYLKAEENSVYTEVQCLV